ncbi:MAG: polysaccharide biosynthesis protein [Lachnospiraceae bacterium]|nr:polysaccharide biosynthesis protein [Lachnospiraceae bacterium]
MTEQKRSNSNFIRQGSILAAASIISRVIGLLYRVPLNAILGDKGAGYYGTAFDIYTLMLLISSSSLPLAVSKLVSARASKGAIKDAYKTFKCALGFGLFMGIAVCLAVWFGADFFAGTLLKTPYAVYAVKVLAPTLVIVAVLGVLRGFFQGLGTMLPSAISQVIEQIINAVVSVVAAYILFGRGLVVGTILGDAEGYSAAYGAAGGTLGTCIGAVAGLLFVAFVFAVFNKPMRKMFRKDKVSVRESFGVILKALVLTVIPVLLSTTLYNLNSIIDQGVFKNLSLARGVSGDDIDVWWGVFTGNFKVLINVPISIAAAMAASSVPAITASFGNGDLDDVRSKVALGIRYIMIIAFPCTVGLFILSTPVMQFLFPKNSVELAGSMMRMGVICVVFYCMSSLTNGILQGINKMIKPVIHAVIALVVQLIFMVILMQFDMGIYALINANTFFALIMCVLNSISIWRELDYKQELLNTFLKPLGASAAMGLVVYFVYAGLNAILGNAIAVCVSIAVGAVIYLGVMLLVRGMDEDILAAFPGGTRLISLCRKLKLLQ